jgi:hypothetical protein
MTSLLLPADELEYAVRATLWELGTASVRELHEHFGEPAGRVYTSTAKLIDWLRAKGLIQRQRLGKAFVYRPRVAWLLQPLPDAALPLESSRTSIGALLTLTLVLAMLLGVACGERVIRPLLALSS